MEYALAIALGVIVASLGVLAVRARMRRWREKEDTAFFACRHLDMYRSVSDGVDNDE